MIILENGHWKEINFKNEQTQFNSHEEFAEQYISDHQDIDSLFQEYCNDYKKYCLRKKEKYVVDPADFLMQYFGFIRVGLKLQDTDHTIMFYRQFPEFDDSKIGEERYSIINTYRARGFKEANNFNNRVSDFIYDMQNEKKFLRSLYSEQDNIR